MRPSRSLPSAALTLFFAAASCAPEMPAPVPPRVEADLAPRPTQLPDPEIEAAVEFEILDDIGEAAADIEVDSTNGIVELTGAAPHLLATERAALVAESVRGVRAVSNRVAVRAIDRPDADIDADIERALVLDPATEAWEIDVTVDDQRVTLRGEVGSWTEKQLATRVAKAIKGVEAVENQIEIAYEGDRSDGEIAADVKARLRWDALVDDGLIEVEVDRQTVRLRGHVGSAAEKRRATAVSWVTGVRAVDDSDLEVSWWMDGDDMIRGKHVRRSPIEIAAALETALSLDPRVASFEIDPVIDGNHVTLRGTVNTLRAKRAAEQIARHTVGVFTVENQLLIDTRADLTDAEIAAHLRWALFANPITESREIGVDVEGGHAVLTGTVDTFTERAEAEDMALGTLGVRSVTNALRVEFPGEAYVYDPYLYPYEPEVDRDGPALPLEPDRKIALEIENEMIWSALVDARDIQVVVQDGVATLRGTVATRAEHDAALALAYEGGAVRVVDELEIDTET